MIESGLDISNVNTIIINKPYLFGLSQLYQLEEEGREVINTSLCLFIIREKHTLK